MRSTSSGAIPIPVSLTSPITPSAPSLRDTVTVPSGLVYLMALSIRLDSSCFICSSVAMINGRELATSKRKSTPLNIALMLISGPMCHNTSPSCMRCTSFAASGRPTVPRFNRSFTRANRAPARSRARWSISWCRTVSPVPYPCRITSRQLCTAAMGARSSCTTCSMGPNPEIRSPSEFCAFPSASARAAARS